MLTLQKIQEENESSKNYIRFLNCLINKPKKESSGNNMHYNLMEMLINKKRCLMTANSPSFRIFYWYQT